MSTPRVLHFNPWKRQVFDAWNVPRHCNHRFIFHQSSFVSASSVCVWIYMGGLQKGVSVYLAFIKNCRIFRFSCRLFVPVLTFQPVDPFSRHLIWTCHCKHHTFPTFSNNNMADARNCGAEATPALLILGFWNGMWYRDKHKCEFCWDDHVDL